MMLREARLWVVIALSAALLCALCAAALRSGVTGSERGQALAATESEKPIISAISRPSANVRLQAQLSVGTARVLPPQRWSRPSLRRIVRVLCSDPKGRELYTRSGGGDPPADATSGSYAILTPNRIGEVTTPRLLATLHTILRTGYSRATQQSHDVAYVTAGDCGDVVGNFSINFETPGWYLLAIHLANPHPFSVSVRNEVWTMAGPSSPSEVLLDQTREVAANGTLLVPLLVEAQREGRKSHLWSSCVSWSGGTGGIVFHAMTVDKL